MCTSVILRFHIGASFRVDHSSKYCQYELQFHKVNALSSVSNPNRVYHSTLSSISSWLYLILPSDSRQSE